MKKKYFKLITFLFFSIFLISVFYFSKLLNSDINYISLRLENNFYIKKEVDLSKKDFKDYKIDDKILKSNLFVKFNNYKYSSKIEKGRENIFYDKK